MNVLNLKFLLVSNINFTKCLHTQKDNGSNTYADKICKVARKNSSFCIGFFPC